MKGLLLALAAAGALSDLALLPPARCVDLSDARQCEAAGPKSWTSAERDVVAGATERLRAHALARGILRGARANGYRGLQRFATDTQRDALGEYVSKFGPGFVLYTPRIIGLTDAFFTLAELRDERSGYRVSDLVLLHEVIHAYDDRKRSTDPGFTSLTGWKFIAGTWQYTNRVSISTYNGVYAETVTLYARERYAEAWTRDRAFATSLPVPLPRLQSLVTPAESFADILAHLILDPTAREYLQPEVVRWFEGHVFPELLTP
jgi:hypothetical protein